MSELPFDLTLEGAPGECVRLSQRVRRVLAPNPSPFTFRGTCTYIVGTGEVAVIDPGPADPAHIEALLAAVADEQVRHILLTHTHRDHYPAIAPLAEATGAMVAGCRGTRESVSAYKPDRILEDGDTIEGRSYRLTALATPGHAANHLCFELEEEKALFSGDHVMGWSTSVVIPPDGNMGDYMASLRRLLDRDHDIYWPGHGGPVTEPKRLVRALLQHRRQREKTILAALGEDPVTIDVIVERVYQGIAENLREAAAQSTLAHLFDLVARGEAASLGPPSRTARYCRANPN
ncbi:glyoxylase-like metal-dependent hydrolase (beta-lactamase superfamily II) [Rhodopseudomonas julia]|uniref:Glyoxylase-like metal-dependent hydrolase (Beta-lactamase superfamily II) n=1 Tax=Rhodopseudomonas julia TaxID=200617 RepID=A0ABU0C4M6_9BRAD|nr:MBL fold metallo-hydrolase [Rhodopseudomonas julia]MDQ0325469.1 glyoxylase-like metal-dependent hydrolase (beta-lactamase superfamily II) [Rhodopseudomonas julia]